ncbi:jg24500 [Pararge aegeria aegeria]|uniref:Jg24500 protein n=1 Tax=Pararge aegeria aegeria TaxID=348720 RepID=A0A8S4RJE6_9NEOP|nr:jg24500 [Pararge aegeria aegeria]
MNLLITFTIVQLVTSSYADTESPSLVAQSFKNDPLVSKVVRNPPSALIKVTYPGRKVSLGSRLEPAQTAGPPKSVSYEADHEKLYTFMFLGPNLPPSGTVPLLQFLHWLIANAPGDDVVKGDTIASYFPPVPYPDGFPYIFLVFEQNGPLNTTQIPNMSFILSRPNFSLEKFAMEHHLNGPIAGNFMELSYLEFVPQVATTAYYLLKAVLGALG